MEILLHICNLLGTILAVLYAYRVIFMIVGIFRTRQYAPAVKNHRYAIVIAARNEAAVIGKLLESIKAQDYPEELLTTFVIADNCTDTTATEARKYGAVCYERKDTEHCTKGYALEFLFEQIERDYGIRYFEGYFVFDADNLLTRDFISRMNDAFDSGERVVVSYRNTKNLGDGWLSASYALHWLRTCRLEHCGRSALGISARIQGTGFLFANEFVSDGWHYTSLTEDRAFSSDVVTRGVRIAYQHAAQFYDEQPTSLLIALRQRLRWAKGNLQAFTETCGALLKGIFQKGGATQKCSSYDMLLFNFPYSAVSVPIKLAKAVLTVLVAVIGGLYGWSYLRLTWDVFQILIFEHLSCIALGFLVFFLERARLPRLSAGQYLLYSLTFPLFGMIGDIVSVVSIFAKVSWKPIPHHADIDIQQLELGISKPKEKTKEKTPQKNSQAHYIER